MKHKYTIKKSKKINSKINSKINNKIKKKTKNTSKKYKIIGNMKYMIYDGINHVFKYISNK